MKTVMGSSGLQGFVAEGELGGFDEMDRCGWTVLETKWGFHN